MKESNYLSSDFKEQRQLPYTEGQTERIPRQVRDRVLSDILKRLEPLTNSDLAREASKYPPFNKMTEYGVKKSVDRFVKDYEALGVVVRDRGKIDWMPQTTKPREEPPQERNTQPESPSSPKTQHEVVQKFIQDLASGSITFRDKPLQKELGWNKGEFYDEVMKDIDLYNAHKHEWPFSGILERRVYDSILKLRAFGCIEEKKEHPDEG
jgi:hypothetical protein